MHLRKCGVVILRILSQILRSHFKMRVTNHLTESGMK